RAASIEMAISEVWSVVFMLKS
ncbi:MAG: hypothetical protein H6Q87_802, partial [candidate division NC10 bacterium]|nr:hypothetical protein [candidate division NC10 bacterium]